MNNFKSPQYNEPAFNCPYCGAYSNMNWFELYFSNFKDFPISDSRLSQCTCCKHYMLWVNKKMILPSNSTAPMPHNDMPDEVKKIYDEAREILAKSPKGASALLRLALQMLCDKLVPGNKNINDKIGELVKNGLPQKLQQAFDLVRIVGNNAVHPGEINLDDNPAMANRLFDLLNIIVEYMIAKPKEIDAFYNNTISEKQKEAIAKRDGRTI